MMPAKPLNPNRIKLHRSYTIAEAAEALGVHKNMIRGMIKNGLELVSPTRPFLIGGAVLRDHVRQHREGLKRPCGPGRFFCFRCKEARGPAGGKVEFVEMTPGSGMLKALCEECGVKMFRRARRDAVTLFMSEVNARITKHEGSLSERSSFFCNRNFASGDHDDV